MSKPITKYLGNDTYEVDGEKYSIKEAKRNSLLKTWTCPHCGHSQLSYKEETTREEHFQRCKKYKKHKK